MGAMKHLLLDAAVAVSKAVEAGASIENILETVDYLNDRPSPTVEKAAWFPTHLPNVESR